MLPISIKRHVEAISAQNSDWWKALYAQAIESRPTGELLKSVDLTTLSNEIVQVERLFPIELYPLMKKITSVYVTRDRISHELKPLTIYSPRAIYDHLLMENELIGYRVEIVYEGDKIDINHDETHPISLHKCGDSKRVQGAFVEVQRPDGAFRHWTMNAHEVNEALAYWKQVVFGGHPTMSDDETIELIIFVRALKHFCVECYFMDNQLNDIMNNIHCYYQHIMHKQEVDKFDLALCCQGKNRFISDEPSKLEAILPTMPEVDYQSDNVVSINSVKTSQSSIDLDDGFGSEGGW